MKAKILMTKKVYSIKQQDDMKKAARLMWEHNCGALPIVNENQEVMGIITDRDIAMTASLQDKPLKDIEVSSGMSSCLYAVHPEQGLDAVLELMSINQVRRIPVVDKKNRLLGIISMNDLAIGSRNDWYKDLNSEDITVTLANICRHPVL